MIAFVVAGVTDEMTYPVCVVLVALAGTTAPVSYAAVRTMIPSLVEVTELGRANSTTVIAW